MAIPRDRALVPAQNQKSDERIEHFRGLGANFLAYLIAMRERGPQTRSVQRVTPDEAIQSYCRILLAPDDVIPIKDHQVHFEREQVCRLRFIAAAKLSLNASLTLSIERPEHSGR